jgi:aspartyl-tRNA(Asn)/glutamyl-tRNA(Gln) amidotransferase subunit B
VTKETRGWDADRGVTFAQRGKEEASDYRYFPDPDLVPVVLTDAQLDALRESLVEPPADRRARFQMAYGLSVYDSGVIVDQGLAFADYFETVAETCGDGKQAANFCTQDVQRVLNERQVGIEQLPISALVLGTLLERIVAGKITVKSGREVLSLLLEESEPTTQRVDQVVAERGLEVVSDTGALQSVVDQVVARNERIADDVRGGKEQAVGPLVGQVMREVKGADPKLVRQMLLDRIHEKT